MDYANSQESAKSFFENASIPYSYINLMKTSLALFDFDGTITFKDTLLDFIKFSVGNKRFYWGLVILSPCLICYFFKITSNHQAKQKLFKFYFRGMRVNQFNKAARDYSLRCIPMIVNSQALKKIQWHRKQKHRIIVVSASIENWIYPWVKTQNIELIATKIEFLQGKVTGNFASKNCFGQEKVNRINQLVDINSYSEIYAYGDSKGDAEMLSIANLKFFRKF